MITTLLNFTDRTSMLSTSETDEHSVTEPASAKIALPSLVWACQQQALCQEWMGDCYCSLVRSPAGRGHHNVDYCKVQLRFVAWLMRNLRH